MAAVGKETNNFPMGYYKSSPDFGFFYFCVLEGTQGLVVDGELDKNEYCEESAVHVRNLRPLVIPGAKGDLLDATVSFVESPTKLYVQLKHQILKIQMLSKELQKNCEGQPIQYNPIRGDIVAAKYSEDEQWYRAAVKRRPDPWSIELYYLDHGNSMTVDKFAIRVLPKELMETPPQAVCINLLQPPTPDFELMCKTLESREVFIRIESTSGEAFFAGVQLEKANGDFSELQEALRDTAALKSIPAPQTASEMKAEASPGGFVAESQKENEVQIRQSSFQVRSEGQSRGPGRVSAGGRGRGGRGEDHSWSLVTFPHQMEVVGRIGIVMKILLKERYGFAWSPELGGVFFPGSVLGKRSVIAGDWVQFSAFSQQRCKSDAWWCARELQLYPDILDDVIVHKDTLTTSSVLCAVRGAPGLVGQVLEGWPTLLWSEELGLMSCSSAFANKLRPNNCVEVLAFPKRGSLEVGWEVRDVQIRPDLQASWQLFPSVKRVTGLVLVSSDGKLAECAADGAVERILVEERNLPVSLEKRQSLSEALLRMGPAEAALIPTLRGHRYQWRVLWMRPVPQPQEATEESSPVPCLPKSVSLTDQSCQTEGELEEEDICAKLMSMPDVANQLLEMAEAMGLKDLPSPPPVTLHRAPNPNHFRVLDKTDFIPPPREYFMTVFQFC